MAIIQKKSFSSPRMVAHTPIILVVRKLRQEDLEFQASGYTVRSCLKKKTKKTNKKN
jgi:hypothetical protein